MKMKMVEMVKDEDLQKSEGNCHLQNQKCDHHSTNQLHASTPSMDSPLPFPFPVLTLTLALALVAKANKARWSSVDNHIGEFLLVVLGKDGLIKIGGYLWFS